MSDTPSDEVPEFVTVGAFVSSKGRRVPATVKVTFIAPFCIFYTQWNGTGGFWEATAYNTLAEALDQLRPATQSEIADWKRYHARFYNLPHTN